jgi:hypothetical protein
LLIERAQMIMRVKPAPAERTSPERVVKYFAIRNSNDYALPGHALELTKSRTICWHRQVFEHFQACDGIECEISKWKRLDRGMSFGWRYVSEGLIAGIDPHYVKARARGLHKAAITASDVENCPSVGGKVS